MRDGRGVQVRPGNGNDVSRDQICVRGRFGYDQTRDKDRLRTARIGRGEDAFEQDGDAVVEHAAAALRAIIERDGPGAVGILGSGQSTNEELVLLRELARGLGVAQLGLVVRAGHGRDRRGAAGCIRLGAPAVAFDLG